MYQLLKVIHLFAVILFMGNIVTGLFWKRHADRTKSRAIIAHTMDGLIRADRWFTIPGVVVITLAGILGAIQGGLPLLRTGWIFWSIVAFSISGVVFALRVAPLQTQLLALSAKSTDETFDWPAYHAKSRSWELWGLVATATPAIAIILMIWKPAL